MLNNIDVTLTNMSVDNKTGFNNLNQGLNNLTTMMYEHNTRLEAILEKIANK
jgi:hypothetical protein